MAVAAAVAVAAAAAAAGGGEGGVINSVFLICQYYPNLLYQLAPVVVIPRDGCVRLSWRSVVSANVSISKACQKAVNDARKAFMAQSIMSLWELAYEP